jgi:hypothetical protein
MPPTVHSYSISSVPFYDTRQQQYIKILCVNSAAVQVMGPLAARVKTVRPLRLSGLQGTETNNCIHALASSSFSDYMTPDDLPELFAFLATNGYTVDLGLTKLAAKHQTSGTSGTNANANALVCLVSYTVS